MHQLGLYEFLALSGSERATLLWKDGCFITNVQQEAGSFALYALYGYYVEVTLEAGLITEIAPFKQGYRLDKYLENIDVAGLKLQ